MSKLYGASCDYLLGIENRYTIILDDLDKRQCKIIDNIVSEISKEIKLFRK